MRVDPKSELLGAVGIPAHAPVQAPELGQDRLALDQADNLNRALEQTPVSRPDEVARAKTLVQTVSYPPIELIHKISTLLAIHIEPSDPSQGQA